MSEHDSRAMARNVRLAVIWRTGSQILAQLVTWTSTFVVIRILEPSDYGLVAMTQVVLALLSLLNGYSFTGALVQAPELDRRQVAQVFGALILMNFAVGGFQFLAAPLVADFYRSPQIADLLRVQSALYLTTPFILVPQALLSRRIDFKLQARANIVAAIATAIVGPACALAGFGVWTLVCASLALYYTRAIMLFILARWWVWPSFRFAGQTWMGFGMAMLVYDIAFFIQSQADIFIGGRGLAPHQVGIYTTALFLAQLLTAKFIPALNEVAFPSYARLQHDPDALATAFVKAARMIMLIAIPFAWGLAVSAEPLVATLLGPKWMEVVPVVRILGIAMPIATLPILCAPATNALGRPAIAAWVTGVGALIMPAAFLIGVRFGPEGLAMAWLGGMPLVAAAAFHFSLPVIGVRPGRLLRALQPAALAGLAMAGAVAGLDAQLPPLAPMLRLALLVAAGGLVYGLALLLFARAVLAEFIGFARGRSLEPADA